MFFCLSLDFDVLFWECTIWGRIQIESVHHHQCLVHFRDVFEICFLSHNNFVLLCWTLAQLLLVLSQIHPNSDRPVRNNRVFSEVHFVCFSIAFTLSLSHIFALFLSVLFYILSNKYTQHTHTTYTNIYYIAFVLHMWKKYLKSSNKHIQDVKNGLTSQDITSFFIWAKVLSFLLLLVFEFLNTFSLIFLFITLFPPEELKYKIRSWRKKTSVSSNSLLVSPSISVLFCSFYTFLFCCGCFFSNSKPVFKHKFLHLKGTKRKKIHKFCFLSSECFLNQLRPVGTISFILVRIIYLTTSRSVTTFEYNFEIFSLKIFLTQKCVEYFFVFVIRTINLRLKR